MFGSEQQVVSVGHSSPSSLWTFLSCVISGCIDSLLLKSASYNPGVADSLLALCQAVDTENIFPGAYMQRGCDLENLLLNMKLVWNVIQIPSNASSLSLFTHAASIRYPILDVDEPLCDLGLPCLLRVFLILLGRSHLASTFFSSVWCFRRRNAQCWPAVLVWTALRQRWCVQPCFPLCSGGQGWYLHPVPAKSWC